MIKEKPTKKKIYQIIINYQIIKKKQINIKYTLEIMRIIKMKNLIIK